MNQKEIIKLAAAQIVKNEIRKTAMPAITQNVQDLLNTLMSAGGEITEVIDPYYNAIIGANWPKDAWRSANRLLSAAQNNPTLLQRTLEGMASGKAFPGLGPASSPGMDWKRLFSDFSYSPWRDIFGSNKGFITPEMLAYGFLPVAGLAAGYAAGNQMREPLARAVWDANYNPAEGENIVSRQPGLTDVEYNDYLKSLPPFEGPVPRISAEYMDDGLFSPPPDIDWSDRMVAPTN